MSAPALDPEWLANLRASADRHPLRPRVPLWAGSSCIGSVEPDLFAGLKSGPRTAAALLSRALRSGTPGWEILGNLTDSLGEIAFAMRDAGLAHAWRDEQLAVTDGQDRVLGTVERAVVRPLGITTFAVHLAGFTSDGRHWVQQRSLTKPNDPGLWDTLMGGMVPATDSLEQALERETWEEAGLKLEQLTHLSHGGRITTRRPTGDSRTGYVVEHIDWYRCVVPEGVIPQNQDGEVAQFRLMDRAELVERLQRDEFTLEAGLVLTEAGI